MSDAVDTARADLRPFAFEDLNRWTLAFRDRKKELRFRIHSRADNLRQARTAIVLVAVLNLPFAALDPFVFADHAVAITLVRVFGISAFCALLYGATRLAWFQTTWPFLMVWMMWGLTLFYATANILGQSQGIYAFGFLLAIAAFYALVPLIFMYSVRQSVLLTVLYVAAMAWGLEMSRVDVVVMAAEFATMNIVGIVVLYRRELAQRRDFANLELIAEQGERNRRLLRRILPEAVAARLEAGESRIAEAFDDAGVLFADIVGFTRLSVGQSPDEMLRFLDTVFARFDRRVEELGLEKIKTIGDAYMVAGGAPGGGGARLEALARLALAMRADVAGLSAPDGSPVRLHIGLHAGPVAAGVVGHNRFLYDLWGDTVNVASRMAALGEGEAIHVTETVRARLDGHFAFAARGDVDVKGRGRLPVWTLEDQIGEGSDAT